MGAGDRVLVGDVARRAGYTVSRRGIVPCPECGAVRRGRRDARPPVDLRDGGYAWWCHVHNDGGTAWAFGRPAPEDVFRPQDHAVTYPDPGDIARLWASAYGHAHDSLAARGIDVEGLAFLDVAKGPPTWRPKWWAWESWATVPLYDQTGALRSLHGRRVENGERVKRGCLPLGYSCEALLMADPAALEAMNGTPVVFGIVCEGITDYMRMVTEVRRRADPFEIGVWGGISGSFRALKPEWAREWIVCTDPDAPGDAYAKQALRAVKSARRFRGEQDVCATLQGGMTLPKLIGAARWMALQEDE